VPVRHFEYALGVSVPPLRAYRFLIRIAALSISCSLFSHAQTIDDGFSVPAKTLYSSSLYTHDSWDHYWEGSLRRTNGNLGTVTTQNTTLFANYGITDRLSVMGTIPYIWTRASQGVLNGMQGWQDVTLAAKYRLITKHLGRAGTVTGYGVGFWGIPTNNYVTDLQPLSIGVGARRAGGRGTLHYQSAQGWFLDGSAAYTWRGQVHLDRPYYFTNDTFYNTNVVDMPNVVDYSLGPGFCRGSRMAQFVWSKRITQGGGGDIRRQDLPFLSNRFISSRVGGVVTYPIPRARGLAFRLEYSRVIDGRNVGLASTVSTGLTQTISFKRRVSVP